MSKADTAHDGAHWCASTQASIRETHLKYTTSTRGSMIAIGRVIWYHTIPACASAVTAENQVKHVDTY